MSKNDWGFRGFTADLGPMPWDDWCGPSTGRGSGRRRQGHRGGKRRRQFFESGEVKYVILRLIREKPRHGYEVIKALEQETGGWYTASAGTVYPTLQLLEDQDWVVEASVFGTRIHLVVDQDAGARQRTTDLLQHHGNAPASAERIVPSIEDVFIHHIEREEARRGIR